MSDLPSLFPCLLTSYQDVIDFHGSHSSEDFNTKIKNACSLCEKAVTLVNTLDLFSTNESIDDLSATEIRYLIIPALYGYFLSYRNDNRLQNLRRSLTLFKEFADLCSSYGVCEFQLGSAPTANGGPTNSSAVSNREAKIKRYKEKKALETKMESLASYVNQPHVDEEIKRDYHLTLVRHWALLVQDEYSTLSQEEQLLELSPEQLKAAEDKSTASERKPMKPFILTRNTVQSAVFGAGYPSISTMTVDQFATEQARRGVFPVGDSALPPLNPNETVRRYDPSDDQRKRDAKQAAKDDSLEDADDAEYLQRARAMDEFKDEHRKGSGNRMNRG